MFNSSAHGITIAEPPVRAPIVDREAVAARCAAAMAMASEVNAYARAVPAVATNAAGIESGLRDRAQALIDALQGGAIDDVFPALLAQLEVAEISARDVLQRKNYKDHDARAIATNPDHVRDYEPGEPL